MGGMVIGGKWCRITATVTAAAAAAAMGLIALSDVSQQYLIFKPHALTHRRYVEKKDFDSAYKVACLGVTEADWHALAEEALQALSLEVGGLALGLQLLLLRPAC